MTQITTQAHRAARNAASIALADTGVVNASLKLYSAQGGTLRATRHLAKPCGEVRLADGRIQLEADESTDIVLSGGGVSWIEWCNGDGVALSAWHLTDTGGNFTDAAGDVVAHPDGVGPFQLAGTTGTMVYVGGVINLHSVLIG